MSINITPGGEDPHIVVAPEGDDPGVVINDETHMTVISNDEVAINVTPGDAASDPPIVVDNSEQTIGVLDEAEDDNDLVVVEEVRGVPGLSAYDIAVLEGFVGTEQEWLDSLEGPEGPAGPAGTAPQSFHWPQDDPVALWVMPHNLGYVSIPNIFDSAGTEWVGEIVFADENNTHVLFPFPFGGDAYFS